MPSQPISKNRLKSIISLFLNCPITVYGDFLADEYIFGEFSRVSREAPVLILEYKESQILPGGAANTVNNLQKLGACPIPIGILGTDVAGKEIKQQFRGLKLPLSSTILVKDYCTPTKTRFVTGSVHSSRQQVLRLDRSKPFKHTGESKNKLWARLRSLSKKSRAMIISDYGFGYVDPEMVTRIPKLLKGFPITIDSRHNLLKFSGLTASTPNEPEVEELLGYKIGNDLGHLQKAGETLLKRLKSEAVLITRGRDGMVLFTRKNPSVNIPIFGSDEVADVTGAGDTVIAVFTLALAVGASFEEAAYLSNYAGGLVVMKHGTATVSHQELMDAIDRDKF